MHRPNLRTLKVTPAGMHAKMRHAHDGLESNEPGARSPCTAWNKQCSRPTSTSTRVSAASAPWTTTDCVRRPLPCLCRHVAEDRADTAESHAPSAGSRMWAMRTHVSSPGRSSPKRLNRRQAPLPHTPQEASVHATTRPTTCMVKGWGTRRPSPDGCQQGRMVKAPKAPAGDRLDAGVGPRLKSACATAAQTGTSRHRTK